MPRRRASADVAARRRRIASLLGRRDPVGVIAVVVAAGRQGQHGRRQHGTPPNQTWSSRSSCIHLTIVPSRDVDDQGTGGRREDDVATDDAAVVGVGRRNVAQTQSVVVTGDRSNTAADTQSVVVGGSSDSAGVNDVAFGGHGRRCDFANGNASVRGEGGLFAADWRDRWASPATGPVVAPPGQAAALLRSWTRPS